MIRELTSSLIHDLISFLKKEKDFFELNTDEKIKKASAALGSTSFSEYISSVSSENFVSDLQLAVSNLKNLQGISQDKSGILLALGNYFNNEFTKVFDHLDKEFYLMSDKKKKEELKKLFGHESSFFKTLREYVFIYSVQEMTEKIVAFISKVFDSKRIVVQSPIIVDRETKNSIRNHFAKEYPNSFVIFSNNSQLIGGVRFIVEGKVIDHSWFSRLQKFHKLTQLA